MKIKEEIIVLEKYYEKDKSINLSPIRAYYIPFYKGEKKSFDREKSGRFKSLNGNWKIRSFDTVLKADRFWEGEGNKEIRVPSCVQYFGYDYFQYTNARYPFPFDPPHIPKKNPAYHYSKKIQLTKTLDERKYIVFEGVDSCFYLYLNGKFIGFSQISHRMSEFDITDYIVDGENKIDVLVLKWCFGSYLEDQDKWRLTGIFRDVYLLSRSINHLVDYKIDTDISGDNGIIRFDNRSDFDLEIKVLEKKEYVKANGSSKIIIENALFWSAETPNLYELDITCGDEIIYERIGIRTSKVKDGVYLFNDKPIKLYGVNRHDFHPEKGYAVSKEDMLEDIILMKKLNVNALRTSHYPASPLLYELCDEYGLYVMSESDLESHGSIYIHDHSKVSFQKLFALIPENEVFRNSIIERQITNVEQNKNHTSVVMWSLGNESGWGENLLEALKEVKNRDGRPIQYEGIYHLDKERYNNDEYYKTPFDMVSMMYPSIEWMKEKYLKDQKETKPLVLCEYAHAMGNGPGGIKDYWELIESNDRFTGAFIWEWADHGIKYDSEGFKYGGDFQELRHDGNFCIDGIVSADRQLKSGTLEMKKIYQPIKITKNNDQITLFNKNFFGEIKGTMKIFCNGKMVEKPISIAPQSNEIIHFTEENVLIEIESNGEIIAYEQFIEEAKFPSEFKDGSVIINEDDCYIYVKNSQMEFKLDKQDGSIINITAFGEAYQDIRLNLWRAPTDNDINVRKEWESHYLNHAEPNVYDYLIEKNKIIFNVKVGYACYKPLVEAKIEYMFGSNGVEINTEYKLTDEKHFAFLPRIGYEFKLNKNYQKLKYFAYGPEETYVDLHGFAIKDEYLSDVDSQYHRYVKPQESGSHYDADYAELSNGNNVIRIEGMKSFSALPYSSKILTDTKHDYELPESLATYLSADIFMTGIGSNSCGPSLDKKYWTPTEGQGKIIFIWKKDKNNQVDYEKK